MNHDREVDAQLTASVERSQEAIARIRCCLRFATTHSPQQFSVTTFMPGATPVELADGMPNSPCRDRLRQTLDKLALSLRR